MAIVLCLYLLLCRGKAIAPDITPPARLRRWAAALFGVMALAHIWWILFYTYSDDTRSVIYGLLVANNSRRALPTCAKPKPNTVLLLHRDTGFPQH